MLKNWGLEPQKDVNLLQIGRLPDMVLAIAQKKVDGGVISFPNSLQAEKMGVKTLLDFAESGLDIPSTTVVASRKYANSHREIVLRFLKAYIEGTRRLAHRQRTRHSRAEKIWRGQRPGASDDNL